MKTRVLKAIYVLFITVSLCVLLWFENYEILTALKDVVIIVVFVLWLLYKTDNNELQNK